MSSREEIKALNYCKQLSDFDIGVRRFAIKKLFELQNPISIPYLIKSLGDSDILVRTNAENTLIAIGPIQLEQIVEELQNNDPEVKLRVLNVYKSYNTLEMSEKILPFIEDPDREVQSIARSIFRRFLNVKTSLLLWQIIKDTKRETKIREIYNEFLAKNCADISNSLIDDLRNEELDTYAMESACKLYLNLNPKGHSYFLDKIKSDNSQVKIASLISYIHFDKENAISHAIHLTDDKNSDVRKTAVKVIGTLGNETHLELLYILKNTPSKQVWQVAREAITQIEERMAQ